MCGHKSGTSVADFPTYLCSLTFKAGFAQFSSFLDTVLFCFISALHYKHTKPYIPTLYPLVSQSCEQSSPACQFICSNSAHWPFCNARTKKCTDRVPWQFQVVQLCGLLWANCALKGVSYSRGVMELKNWELMVEGGGLEDCQKSLYSLYSILLFECRKNTSKFCCRLFAKTNQKFMKLRVFKIVHHFSSFIHYVQLVVFNVLWISIGKIFRLVVPISVVEPEPQETQFLT